MNIQLILIKIDQNPGEPLGITDLELENVKVFYNNPANEYINLKIDPGFRKDVRIEIFSIQGVKLYSKQFSINIKSIEDQINVSGFPDGMYILNISNPNGLLYSSKIVIQN